jgi:hypothetical protein
VINFLFDLLKIKGLYMLLALLAHPQEDCTYGTRYISWVLCQLAAPVLLQTTGITRTQYIKCRLCSASWRWASNARNMYRPLILNKLNKKYITLVSLYWSSKLFGQPLVCLDAFHNLFSLTCCAVLLNYSKTASYAVVPVYNISPIGPERQVSTELWFSIAVFYFLSPRYI